LGLPTKALHAKASLQDIQIVQHWCTEKVGMSKRMSTLQIAGIKENKHAVDSWRGRSREYWNGLIQQQLNSFIPSHH
jgi:hypothetical protein